MNRLAATLTTALAPITWGTTYLVTTELLPEGRPLLTATLRALPVGLLFIAIFRQLPKGAWWWRVFVLGGLNFAIFFSLLFVAAYRLPGGIAATLGATSPLLAAVFAWPLLGERLAAPTVVAGLLGVAGVGLMVLRSGVALDAVGVAAAVSMSVSFAAGLVLTKRWERPAPVLVFTAWQLAAGGLLLAPVAFVVEGPPPVFDLENVLGYAYLGLVGTGLAYALVFRGLEKLPASAVAFLSLLSPVTASVLGLLVLGQTFTPAQVLGAALVFCGVIMGQLVSDNGESRPSGCIVARRADR